MICAEFGITLHTQIVCRTQKAIKEGHTDGMDQPFNYLDTRSVAEAFNSRTRAGIKLNSKGDPDRELLLLLGMMMGRRS